MVLGIYNKLQITFNVHKKQLLKVIRTLELLICDNQHMVSEVCFD